MGTVLLVGIIVGIALRKIYTAIKSTTYRTKDVKKSALKEDDRMQTHD